MLSSFAHHPEAARLPSSLSSRGMSKRPSRMPRLVFATSSGVNTHTIHFQVVCASFLKITGPLGPGSVSSFLYSFGLNAEVLLAEGQKPLYVLLDETQSVYHVSDDFWSRTLKSLFGYNPKCKTRILLFAAHGGVQRTGLTTPFDPVGNELTITFLRYRRVHELLQTAYFLNPSLSLFIGRTRAAHRPLQRVFASAPLCAALACCEQGACLYNESPSWNRVCDPALALREVQGDAAREPSLLGRHDSQRVHSEQFVFPVLFLFQLSHRCNRCNG